MDYYKRVAKTKDLQTRRNSRTNKGNRRHIRSITKRQTRKETNDAMRTL